MNNIITNKDVLKYFIDNYGINKTISKEINGKKIEIDILNYIEKLKEELNSLVSDDITAIKKEMKIQEERLKTSKRNQLEYQKEQDFKKAPIYSIFKKYRSIYNDEMKQIDDKILNRTTQKIEDITKAKLLTESYNEYFIIINELHNIYMQIIIKNTDNINNINKEYTAVIDIENEYEIIFKIYIDQKPELILDNYNNEKEEFTIQNINIKINFYILKDILNYIFSGSRYVIYYIIIYYLYSCHIKSYLTSQNIHHINNYSINLPPSYINISNINNTTDIVYILIEINKQIYLFNYTSQSDIINKILLLLKIHYGKDYIYKTINEDINKEINKIDKKIENNILYLNITINRHVEQIIIYDRTFEGYTDIIRNNIKPNDPVYNIIITREISDDAKKFFYNYLVHNTTGKTGGKNKKFKVFYNDKNKKYYINYNNRKQYLSYKNTYKDNKNGKFYMKLKGFKIELYI